MGSPIEIRTPKDFFNIRNNLSADYVLTNDIDLSQYATKEYKRSTGIIDELTGGVILETFAVGWEPIGDFHQPFLGNIDGCGFSISGLYFRREGLSFNGLFGVAKRGSISNFSIHECDIVGGYRTQAILGYNYMDLCLLENNYYSGMVVELK